CALGRRRIAQSKRASSDGELEAGLSGKGTLPENASGRVADESAQSSVHHRGQLSVYLRLLDVPVPVVYGPTADENPFV
ncbi:MAG TPA: hypothetical protein VFU57_03625, partial [Candidatus Acidoferrales bacterium]|nr:hypothetical protein [Candidatus Acidoferrales bacterium]